MSVWTPERQEAARASLARWHGTPHRDRIAAVGLGVDCVNLVHSVLHEAGVLPDAVLNGYDVTLGMWGESTALKEAMLECLHGLWVEDGFEFGDVLLFKTGRRSAHCGLHTGDGYVWHALANRCVTRSDFCLWKRDVAGGVRLTDVGFKTRPDMVKIKH